MLACLSFYSHKATAYHATLVLPIMLYRDGGDRGNARHVYFVMRALMLLLSLRDRDRQA